MKPEQVNWNNPHAKVSLYFTVGEVTQHDPRRIPKTDLVKKNVLFLAAKLDIIRVAWGHPIGVTSWYRPPHINKAVGGVANSQHINGSAVDIYPLGGGTLLEFQSWLDKRWDRALGYGAKKGFVHLDLRKGRIRWNY